ncbi:MAG TPA: hypothetical protein VFN48_07120 [Solirubrobacteraceae bacterium]|nr:hypothetical protein [Solirubrobacteraceae bacterium]
MALFSAIQLETGQPLGPPEGRYLMRPRAGEPPSRVLVFAGTLTTVISVERPLENDRAGAEWLRRAGEDELAEALTALDRAMHAFRQIVADPHVSAPGRRQLVGARAGYGDGDALADGRFSDSRELPAPKGPRFQRRAKVLEPQARLAAALSGREPSLVCAELALRAGADLEAGRPREAALGAMIAVDTAIAELSLDGRAGTLAARVTELRGLRASVVTVAQTALSADPDAAATATVSHALGRLEAALRARAVASA